MKVFRFYPELESGQFQERGRQRFITCMVIRALCTLLYSCGVLFICVRAVQSLSSDKRIAPHFLLWAIPFGAREER